LADVLLKRGVIHPRMRLMIEQICFMQIKTIIAIDIALRARRFVHRMKAIVSASGEWREFELRLLHGEYAYLLIFVILFP
jgi:hypothetical protein